MLSNIEGFATICDLVDYLSASDILRMDYIRRDRNKEADGGNS